MKFTKLQSAGNDFVLVEVVGRELDWPKLAKSICHRHFGVGADGLLLLVSSEVADFGMRIFNSDGSEAEACGNGLRCLVRHIIGRGLLPAGAEEVSVETVAGVRKVRLHRESGEVIKIEVGMGTPGFAAEEVPVSVESGKGNIANETGFISSYPVNVDGRKLTLCFVSMGNPHAVYLTKEPVSGFPLSLLGPSIESSKLFPNRVNFEVARVLSRQKIEVRVWERGVGETLACGSGACAVAVCAQLLGHADNEVDIILPGGTLEVKWAGLGEVLLSGQAEAVFSGEWSNEVRV